MYPDLDAMFVAVAPIATVDNALALLTALSFLTLSMILKEALAGILYWTRTSLTLPNKVSGLCNLFSSWIFVIASVRLVSLPIILAPISMPVVTISPIA